MATTSGQTDLTAENERLRLRLTQLEHAGDEIVQLRAAIAAQAAELAAARDQRDATAALLRTIATPAGPSHDLDATLTAIAAQAARVCGADDGAIWIAHPLPTEREAPIGYGHPIRLAAHVGSVPLATPVGSVRPLVEHGTTDTAVVERRIVHLPDTADPALDAAFPRVREATARIGVRSVLIAPLLRGDHTLGAIVIRRTEPGPFAEDQLAQLETFATHAVIAIENARLFQELQERLEEQTASAEILRSIARTSADARGVLEAIARTAAKLVDARYADILRVEGQDMVMEAQWRPPGAEGEALLRVGVRHPIRADYAGGRAVVERRSVHVPDMANVAPEEGYDPQVVQIFVRQRWRSVLCAPLLSEGRVVGVLAVGRSGQDGGARPFGAREVALLESLADQAVIAIENARLFSDLQQTNATLKEALEQQTATSSVLRVIAGSPTDLASVFAAIAESARDLCGATDAVVHLTDGEHLWPTVGVGPSWRGDGVRAARLTPPAWAVRVDGPHGNLTSKRAILTRRTQHVPDLLADPELRERMARSVELGVRAIVCAPLAGPSGVVGTISAFRSEPGAFTAEQIALLETFADQAVVAVENSRLFEQLRERDERRRQELERAAAIQRRLLPSSIEGWPGVLEVARRFRPAVETSGDFFDVLPLTPTRPGDLPPLQVAVGDVAGKGMSAALVTALARSALQTTTSVPTQMATPAGTLRVAGSRLHRDVGAGHFVACALAIVEPPGPLHRGPRLTLSNAAQVPVLLVRDGAAREIETPGDRLPLGARPDGDYQDVRAELRAGDAVVFSSDGLVEAPALASAAAPGHLPAPEAPRDLFGFARLASSASHWAARADSAEAIAAGIWSDLTAWCGEESHHDDMTLLVLRVPHSPHA